MSDSGPTGPGRPKIGLALAGGGPEGAVYEIGALRAVDEALDGIDLNEMYIYVGVSAGSFVASCLVNGVTTRDLCLATLGNDPRRLNFTPNTFYTPSVKEFWHRTTSAPRLAFEAILDYIENPKDQSLVGSLSRLTRSLPVGLFDNEPIRAYLKRVFSLPGHTDNFRELRSKFVVVAAELDTGRAVLFGNGEFADVPISRAVQASTALPGLYPPVEIGGRYYVDGVLLKTLHASVALESGAELLLCLNPIVPVDTTDSVEAGVMRRGKLVDRGLPTVLSQTFRTLVHSRLSVGLASYEPRFPSSDVILIEPGRDDYRMFFTNIFSMSNRRAVCEHAYQSTRKQLLRRKDELSPILEPHGVRLRTDVLEEERDLASSVGLRDCGKVPVTEELDRTLTKLEEILDGS